MMDAIVFDIDGTLLDSSGIDSRLYIESIKTILGEVKLRPDWSDYEHVTDQGVLRDIIRDNGLSRERELISQVKRVFLQSIAEHLRTQGPFREIPGARRFVRALNQSSEMRVAYATGGWTHSAKLKLESAGFPLDDLPLASSDDHDDRVSIMRSAAARFPESTNRVIYFGDAIWDQRACEELGWQFVAVGTALGGIENFDSVERFIDQIRKN